MPKILMATPSGFLNERPPDTMRRADRLFQMVQLLRGGRLVTARQMANRLEVSEVFFADALLALGAIGVSRSTPLKAPSVFQA